VAAEGMIAVRVTGPMKMAVVGAPSYFAQWRAPREFPMKLVHHSWRSLRLSPEKAPPLRGHSCGWQDAAISVGRVAVAMRIWPVARRRRLASHSRSNSGRTVSYARVNWSGAEDGRPRSMDILSIFRAPAGPAALRALLDMIRASRKLGAGQAFAQESFCQGLSGGMTCHA